MGLFSLSQMPGAIARTIQSWKNDSLYVHHPALVGFLNMRKHLGLLGLYFLFMHAIMCLLNFGPGGYYVAFYDTNDPTKMNVTGEVSVLFAILSTSLYIIVGLASLPSVGESMNKAQSEFVFGPVVWFALACGHVHNLVIYFEMFKGSRERIGGIPHVTLLGSLLPWLAFFLKFVQLCVTYCMPVILRLLGIQMRHRPSTTKHSGYRRQFNPAAEETIVFGLQKELQDLNKKVETLTNLWMQEETIHSELDKAERSGDVAKVMKLEEKKQGIFRHMAALSSPMPEKSKQVHTDVFQLHMSTSEDMSMSTSSAEDASILTEDSSSVAVDQSDNSLEGQTESESDSSGLCQSASSESRDRTLKSAPPTVAII